MILYYNQCYGLNTQKILEDIDSNNAKTVVLLGESEWEMREVTKDFVDALNNRNVTLKIVHGSCINEHYEKRYADVGLPIENVTFWGTHWINYSYISLMGQGFRPENYIVNTDNFKYKFISLNNRSHVHRCAFIDEMARHNLIDKGAVSWVKHLNENSDYPFKHFDNRQILLGDDFVTKLDSFLLPDEWHQSLLHVVTECTPHVYCISEKTCIPLLMKKPFIIFGAKGYSENLTKLGFQLYDEIFDYGFDKIDDLTERADAFVGNLHLLDNYEPKDLYNRLYDKIRHNYNRAIEILTDNSLIPDIVMDFYRQDRYSDWAGKIDYFLTLKPQKIRWYSVWSDNPKFLTEIDNDSTSEVIVDNTVETFYAQIQDDLSGVKNLYNVCQQHNVPMTLLSAGYRFNQHQLDSEIAKKINIVDNPCFWFAKHLQSMLESVHHNMNLSRGYDILDSEVGLPTEIDHLYITMNNLAKFHRCLMMDMLCKHDLIDKGAIAWRDKHRKFDGVRPLPNGEAESYASTYQFQYWTPKKMHLDFEDDNTSFVNQNILPNQYRNSFMQLVAESEDNDIFFISEKTVVPILCNKPFLVLSCDNYHNNLKELGFKLYDELFDYSFDSVKSLYKRMDLIALEIKKFESYSKEELLELTNAIKPKLKHNRELAFDYIRQVMSQYTPYLKKLENQEIYTQLGLITKLEPYVDRF